MAGIFGGDCAVCAAKDQHIAFLQTQVSALTAKMAEILSPGANARAAYVLPTREKKDTPLPVPQSHSPSRLARIRQDRRTTPESEGREVIARAERAIVEQSFERGNG